LIVLLASLIGTPLPADAAEDDDEGAQSVEIHGFVSQGGILTTDNNYLVRSKRGSVEFSEMGLNFTTRLGDKLRLGMQLFSSKLGATGNFNVKADWFYLDYHWRDWLGLRAGRVKLPFGLYNDTSDIDAARVPVLLPQSIYPLADRDFLLAQTGLELYGYLNLRTAGALEYRLYGGTIFIPLTNPAGSPVTLTSITTRYVAGGRILWETPLEGLRLGGSLQALEVEADLMTTGPVHVKLPAVLWVASLEYAAHDWLLAIEYSRWHLRRLTSSDETLYPASPANASERAYALLAYRVNRWLEPAIYYSRYVRVVEESLRPVGARESGSFQDDLSGTLRFDINAFWLVKVEGHYMHGTGVLDPSLNGGAAVTRDSLVRNWGAFFVKTTAYF
jgi:hypothetical protein